eukprot:6197950-Pleurochrysis_carterae.AAC.2
MSPSGDKGQARHENKKYAYSGRSERQNLYLKGSIIPRYGVTSQCITLSAERESTLLSFVEAKQTRNFLTPVAHAHHRASGLALPSDNLTWWPNLTVQC